MVVCTFKDGTAMDEVFSVIAEEKAQVEVLTAAGQLGAIHLSMGRATVFIETFAADDDEAASNVRTLPMSKWWNLDVHPLGAPSLPGASS